MSSGKSPAEFGRPRRPRGRLDLGARLASKARRAGFPSFQEQTLQRTLAARRLRRRIGAPHAVQWPRSASDSALVVGAEVVEPVEESSSGQRTTFATARQIASDRLRLVPDAIISGRGERAERVTCQIPRVLSTDTPTPRFFKSDKSGSARDSSVEYAGTLGESPSSCWATARSSCDPGLWGIRTRF